MPASTSSPDRPILGIETSCDETACAVYDGERGLLAHVLHSQIRLHAEYGGVVPELASRDHVARIHGLVAAVLEQAGLTPAGLGGIAYTAGPGLIGALMVGGAVASGLAAALDLPLIPVHHMEAHLLAPMLEERRPTFPFVALLVSGGHTLLVAVRGIGDYELLGESVDDAVGEAFDKTAKLLGLPYPGGPELARLAEGGDGRRYKFPRPMTDRPGLDFSFSGLKTAVLTTLNAEGRGGSERGIPAASPHLGVLPGAGSERGIPAASPHLGVLPGAGSERGIPAPHSGILSGADLAASFQEAVTDTLAIKCTRALAQTGYAQLIVAGGVGANRRLREKLGALAQRDGFDLFFPRQAFCTDNGAMIAYTGWARRREGRRADAGLFTTPRWPLAELRPPPA